MTTDSAYGTHMTPSLGCGEVEHFRDRVGGCGLLTPWLQPISANPDTHALQF